MSLLNPGRIYSFYKYVCSNINLNCSQRYCTNGFAKRNLSFRTHTCGELQEEHVGEEVTLCGWLTAHRFSKFIVLCDAHGSMQVLLDQCDPSLSKYLVTLPLESVLQVKGIVQKRPPSKVNKLMPTGGMEVLLKDAKLLSSTSPNLPCTVKDFDKVGNVTKLKYRYLYLRKPEMQKNLRTRYKVLKKMRDYLDEHGFVEIETPTLYRKTPGGAKEFVVPSHIPGRFFALPQSPQQLKQMLMIGRFDKYFQIARCYRNESTRSDRQPEFTQIDIEESFTTTEDIKVLIEGLLKYSWQISGSELSIPFPSMTYREAMEQYGTDKPDIRYEMKLQYLTTELVGRGIEIFDKSFSETNGVVAAIVVPSGSKNITKSQINDMKEEAKLYFSQNLLDVQVKKDLKWSSVLSKHVTMDLQLELNEILNLKPQDLVLIAAGKYHNVVSLLGKVRVQCADYLENSGVPLWKPNDFKFLWIKDFPLFVPNSEGILESSHHPFTSPHPSHVDLVYTNPSGALGQSYDLVLNGQEIGGGSIRICDPILQRYILEDVLKLDTSSFEYFLEALGSGCPPHGGIALGVDRLLAIMCGYKSITNVIAFPKSKDGNDLLSGAPAYLLDDEIQEIEKHLKLQ